MRKTEYTITARIKPIRAALLSDLHDRDASEVIVMLRRDPPDLILIAGDLYESPPRNPFSYRNALRLLRETAGLCPTVYCKGNHDESSTDELDQALAAAGVIELSDSSTELCGMCIGGLRSALYTGGVPNLDFLDRFSKKPGYKLLLCHHPEYYPRYIRERSIELTVSGHAHGGQWAILGRGVFAPGQGLFPKYTRGVHEGRLVVSRGLANSVRIPRIGAPTELVYLTIGE